MFDLSKILREEYDKKNTITSQSLVEMIEEMMDSGIFTIEEQKREGKTKQITLKMPIIRLSEKMWGKKGTKDREVIQKLLAKIVGKGRTLSDKVQAINSFLDSPPQTDDISEVLTHIVLLDTLTNIMVHFNASAAGFTFEGFLAAMLEGEQIPPGTAGIQDIVDNDKNPISLKLLTEKPGDVHGSYRDLVDHFIDPGGLKRDPETDQYVGQAGAEGRMRYVVALKTFREKEAEAKLKGREYITFYQFDFTAKTFLESMMSSKQNANLLLLPADLTIAPEIPGNQDTTYDPFPADRLKFLYAKRDLNRRTAGTANTYLKIINNYDSDFAKEVLDGAEIIPHPENPKKGQLVGPDGEPIVYKKLSAGDVRWKKIGAITHKDYLDYRTSIKILQRALVEDPAQFWGLIARTSGYEGSAGETQFIISSSYFKDMNYGQDGFGYVGRINVGREAVDELAQKYVDVLNQQIFDIFEKVERLTNQINGYFVAGNKEDGLAAAITAEEIKSGTEEYIQTQAEESIP